MDAYGVEIININDKPLVWGGGRDKPLAQS